MPKAKYCRTCKSLAPAEHDCETWKPQPQKRISYHKAIRLMCLDCSNDSAHYVRWCPCDGIHGHDCPLWPGSGSVCVLKPLKGSTASSSSLPR